jgi:hypothetical protein
VQKSIHVGGDRWKIACRGHEARRNFQRQPRRRRFDFKHETQCNDFYTYHTDLYSLQMKHLLVDPRLSNRGVLGDTLREPAATRTMISPPFFSHRRRRNSQRDLLLSVLNRVGTVADVTANSESVVTTDGANGGGEGVGGTEHGTPGLDGVETFPDHADDGARGHVLDEAGEEGLASEVGVVCGLGGGTDVRVVKRVLIRCEEMGSIVKESTR